MARETAMREVRQGKRALFLCYTGALSAFLNTCLNEPALKIKKVDYCKKIFASVTGYVTQVCYGFP